MDEKDDFYLNCAMNAVALFFFGCVPLGTALATGYVIAGEDGVAGVILVMCVCFVVGTKIEVGRRRKAARPK
jgi:hypothetical protein